jgi:uncharacterized protein (TIGR00725 family)
MYGANHDWSYGARADASTEEMDTAYELGEQIGLQEWIALSGGRNCGVMNAVYCRAKSVGGFTVGILPADNKANAMGGASRNGGRSIAHSTIRIDSLTILTNASSKYP